jgi:ribosomal protein S18 acetylase RimI-like enzyme
MTTIGTAVAPDAVALLDELLWTVLWKPLGLPRDARRSFALEGAELELVACEDGLVVGGLVAVRQPGGEIELRHLAVAAHAQGRGIGRALVTELCRRAAAEGCPRVLVTARSSSAGFFRALGFSVLPRPAPSHPAFAARGIGFKLMEKPLEGDTSAGRPEAGTHRSG